MSCVSILYFITDVTRGLWDIGSECQRGGGTSKMPKIEKRGGGGTKP